MRSGTARPRFLTAERRFPVRRTRSDRLEKELGMLKKLILGGLVLGGSILALAERTFATEVTSNKLYISVFKGVLPSPSDPTRTGLELTLYPDNPWIYSTTTGPRVNSAVNPTEAHAIHGSLGAGSQSKKLHWMRFQFDTGNYFAAMSKTGETGHITIGLRGLYLNFPAASPGLSGHGIAIGDGVAGGGSCLNRGISIERYGRAYSLGAPTNTAIISSTCRTNIFQDYSSYFVEVHVSEVGPTRWIAYWVKDSFGSTVAEALYSDPAPDPKKEDIAKIPLNGDGTGWWLAHVSSERFADQVFSFVIRNFEAGATD